MAITSRKISSFPQLTSLSGDEFLMVSYNGKSYKIPISLLTGNSIQSITQKFSNVDGGDNPITMKIGTNENETVYTFHVYNGKQGSQGPEGKQGPKGLTGDTGVALYNEDVEDLIYDSLEENDEAELSKLILSASQGVILNQRLNELKEIFLTQNEYDELVELDGIDPNMKYFIWEE